jgi:hypothetical protein
VPRDLFAEKERFFHEVTYGWRGMPTQTKLVDLGREVTVGTQIKVDGLWWVVEQVGPAVGGHRGRVRATTAALWPPGLGEPFTGAQTTSRADVLNVDSPLTDPWCPVRRAASPNGSFTYTPAADYNGLDAFFTGRATAACRRTLRWCRSRSIR